MSATNKTTHYELPSFIASDKPAWLVDWNGAMAAIDAAIYEAKTSADTAGTDVTQIQSDLTTLAGTVTTQGTTLTTLTSSLTTLTGTVNTITSLIGNGEPTTTDKTIIGAINELHADITGGGTQEISAANVSYNNTSSQLQASNVQNAIDEVYNLIPSADLPMRMIVIGDSYAVDATTASPNFADNLKSDFGLTGNNFYNISARGIGIVQKNTDTDDTLSIITAAASSIANHDTITHIVITPGLNDTKTVDPADIPAAVTALVSYLKTTYPNAKLYYGFIGNFLSSPGAAGVTGLSKYLKGLSALYNAFASEGVQVMNGVEYICHDASNLGSDLTHPSVKGSKNIATFIENCINYGSSSYYASYALMDSHNNEVDVTFNNDKVLIKYPYYAPSSAFSSGAASFIEIANSPLQGIITDSVFFNDFASVDGTNAIHHFRIREGVIQVIQSGATTLGSAGNGFTMMSTLTV